MGVGGDGVFGTVAPELVLAVTAKDNVIAAFALEVDVVADVGVEDVFYHGERTTV